MVGIDIVEIERITKLRNLYGKRFLSRVFTEGEIAYSTGKARADESLAARFAAKEAFIKAHGAPSVWKKIEVVSGDGGKPYILYQGQRFDGVSLSHERSYAVAMVVI
jgi:holo-[acyl-carrier protein] synthase